MVILAHTFFFQMILATRFSPVRINVIMLIIKYLNSSAERYRKHIAKTRQASTQPIQTIDNQIVTIRFSSMNHRND